jgi:hypothetical protein
MMTIPSKWSMSPPGGAEAAALAEDEDAEDVPYRNQLLCCKYIRTIKAMSKHGFIFFLVVY